MALVWLKVLTTGKEMAAGKGIVSFCFSIYLTIQWLCLHPKSNKSMIAGKLFGYLNIYTVCCIYELTNFRALILNQILGNVEI